MPVGKGQAAVGLTTVFASGAATTAALAAGAAAAGVLVAKNIGTAITRIDTLVAFPRVLQAMDAP